MQPVCVYIILSCETCKQWVKDCPDIVRSSPPPVVTNIQLHKGLCTPDCALNNDDRALFLLTVIILSEKAFIWDLFQADESKQKMKMNI